MASQITVIGLGPGDAELISAETSAAIAKHSRRFLRTSRHPAAAAVPDAISFDYVYDQARSYDEVYQTIVDRLIDEAAHGDLLYAVPGSPLVLERSVALLRQHCASPGRQPSNGVGLKVLAAMSFLDLAWARLDVDPVEAGVRLVDGHQFAVSAAGHPGPLLVANCHSRWVLSDMKLAVEQEPPAVVVLQRLGLADETIRRVAWADLDREVAADHLTSVYVPELAEPVAADLVRFDELVRILREQCPWDKAQTHASLRRHLLEETYETLEAIDELAALEDGAVDDKVDGHLQEELGDLLYQVWFQARLAAERGAFTVSDVARGAHDKLVERHPHVFSDVVADDVAAVRSNWETNKQREKGRASVMDGLPATLPALLRAAKLLKRADASNLLAARARVPVTEALEQATAALRSQPDEQHLGEMLLAVVELAHHLNLDPEDALRRATARAERDLRVAEQHRLSQPSSPAINSN